MAGSTASRLFEAGLGLDWLPDETVFSLVSRYHVLACNHKPSQTCLQVFGHLRGGSSQDFPSRTELLSSQSGGTLGSGFEIITRHSIVPYFFPFHPGPRCRRWLEQLAAGCAAAVKAEIGLFASQFGANFPLRACPQCMEEDLKDHFVAYWHVAHQLPGVSVCLKHRQGLVLSRLKVSGKDRFAWLLPAQAELREPPREFDPVGTACSCAEMSGQLRHMPIDFCFDLAHLRRICRHRAMELGLLDRQGRLDAPRFNVLVRRVIDSAGLLAQSSWLLPHEVKETMARRLIRILHNSSPRTSRHPLNHILLWLALFETWERFWTAYLNQDSLVVSVVFSNDSKIQTAKVSSVDPRKAEFLRMIRGGHTVSAAARSAKVAVATGQAWAAAAGQDNRRRPKKLGPELRRDLVRRLRRGANKIKVAEIFDISVVTVTRILFTEPGLHAAWEDARRRRAQRSARSAWSHLLRSFPEMSSAEWRRLQPAVYAWLYRNDRSWLQDSIRRRGQPAKSVPLRRDWEGRDKYLSRAIRQQALDWHWANPQTPLTVGTLCGLIPELKPKMGDLDKLPMTRLAIREAVTRHGPVNK